MGSVKFIQKSDGGIEIEFATNDVLGPVKLEIPTDFRGVEPMSAGQASYSGDDGAWGPMSEARLLAYEESGAPDWLCKEIRWQQATIERLRGDCNRRHVTEVDLLSKCAGLESQLADGIAQRMRDTAAVAYQQECIRLRRENAEMRQWIEKVVDQQHASNARVIPLPKCMMSEPIVAWPTKAPPVY